MCEIANIREHCSWVHEKGEATTQKALDLVRMQVEKVKKELYRDTFGNIFFRKLCQFLNGIYQKNGIMIIFFILFNGV